MALEVQAAVRGLGVGVMVRVRVGVHVFSARP